jgi:hypothetical protein
MNRSIIPDTEWVFTAPPSPTPISSRLQSHPSLENFVILSDPSTEEATEGSYTEAEVQTDDGNTTGGEATTTTPSYVDALQQDKRELHTGPANIFRNYQIKSIMPREDATEEHQKSLQREMPRGTGIFSNYHPQPTTTWFPRPQEAPKPLHPHHFGGLCFDLDHNTWSTCHVIENNGVIEDRSRNLYDIGNADGADGAMIDHDLDIVGQLGLAAGKIYLRGRKIVSMSGFFLEKRLFVSAAPFEEALGKQFLHGKISTLRLSDIGRFPFLVVSGFRIIIVLCVCTIGADPWIREAELIYLDHTSDIAVYRLLQGVPDPENWCSLGQLVPGNQIKEGSRVFTVGYNGTSNRQDFFANTDAYFANLSPSKQKELRLCGVRAVSSSSLECAFASPNLT